MPYADLSFSVIGLGYEGSGPYDGDEIVYAGGGGSLGGGVLYFLSPTVALEGSLTFTPGSLEEMAVDGDTEDVEETWTSSSWARACTWA